MRIFFVFCIKNFSFFQRVLDINFLDHGNVKYLNMACQIPPALWAYITNLYDWQCYSTIAERCMGLKVRRG